MELRYKNCRRTTPIHNSRVNPAAAFVPSGLIITGDIRGDAEKNERKRSTVPVSTHHNPQDGDRAELAR